MLKPTLESDKQALSQIGDMQQNKADITPTCHTYTLEQLLAQMTAKNLHPEQEIGPTVGREEWE